jgi:hypothetical protein
MIHAVRGLVNGAKVDISRKDIKIDGQNSFIQFSLFKEEIL